jgi:hypothetical protein
MGPTRRLEDIDKIDGTTRISGYGSILDFVNKVMTVRNARRKYLNRLNPHTYGMGSASLDRLSVRPTGKPSAVCLQFIILSRALNLEASQKRESSNRRCGESRHYTFKLHG